MKKGKKYVLSKATNFCFKTTKADFIKEQNRIIEAQKSLAEITRLCEQKIKYFEENFLIS
ncbi:hypothetical protein QJV45_02590 [Listeria booriae]|uniref:hypothetical protein n=1 Tax=Listeria booriae TaxID=1552123 RepID=UPI0028802540|nr:hypothetical protein [Listeria booriae]MDT0109330.1 hypothetical protein [Listeria booriae]